MLSVPACEHESQQQADGCADAGRLPRILVHVVVGCSCRLACLIGDITPHGFDGSLCGRYVLAQLVLGAGQIFDGERSCRRDQVLDVRNEAVELTLGARSCIDDGLCGAKATATGLGLVGWIEHVASWRNVLS